MAGVDDTLLALTGTGYMGGKLFGFASCPREVGASEGMNVLSERCVPSTGTYSPNCLCTLQPYHLACVTVNMQLAIFGFCTAYDPGEGIAPC